MLAVVTAVKRGRARGRKGHGKTKGQGQLIYTLVRKVKTDSTGEIHLETVFGGCFRQLATRKFNLAC